MKKTAGFFAQLFVSSLKISAFTFGGGAVIVSMMKKEFVDRLGWISEEDMMDYTVIAQSVPGAVAVNASMIMGYRIAGAAGALVATAGTILPPLALLSAISYFYMFFINNTAVKYILAGMSAGVCAVIADAVLSMAKTVLKSKTLVSALLMGGAFAAVFVFKVNVMYIIAAAALAGALFFRNTDHKNDG